MWWTNKLTNYFVIQSLFSRFSWWSSQRIYNKKINNFSICFSFHSLLTVNKTFSPFPEAFCRWHRNNIHVSVLFSFIILPVIFYRYWRIDFLSKLERFLLKDAKTIRRVENGYYYSKFNHHLCVTGRWVSY